MLYTFNIHFLTLDFCIHWLSILWYSLNSIFYNIISNFLSICRDNVMLQEDIIITTVFSFNIYTNLFPNLTWNIYNQ